MSENSCPNSETKKTPTKISIEERLKRDEIELNSQKEQNKICNEYIAKFEADVIALQAKLEKEKENTNARIQKLKDELNAQICQIIDQTRESVEIESKVPLFDVEKLKVVKGNTSSIKNALSSISEDFKNEFQSFLKEFTATKDSTKQVLMKFTAQKYSETEESTKNDNARLQKEIISSASELSRQVSKLSKVEISQSSPSYMEKSVKEKVYVDSATDAHEVPEKVVRLSSFAAKWMLQYQEFLS
ncbi:hypothetical protein TVAG_265870 [Trichomonas vaginalis G3]|uniref:Uncharacterized protein n=1 Tax=Trichomonas vaginalis (strain ATCC PRA-98 / G3) TaxID=412133 RepID=A2F2I4_TRIV3|nr:Apolipoprotein A-I family [Trichomonas vaginalis G3]EAY00884.1 hypothetical protein TVAG_265870 [Trichomonas vaginalis G3]KAI5489243.1 Apolipoprotein A-I family [Trichomonas vaginalis G3]|eukprot:XP_001313813.1 hypothetical protein [Trichomonas vaginalis G3]